jgi:hypothetical protein
MKNLLLICFLFSVTAIGCDTPTVLVEDQRFVVYPNPAGKTAYVYVKNDNQPYSLKVFDTRGKLVMSKESPGGGNIQMQVELAEAGTYRFTLDMSNVKGTRTIISDPQ